MQIKRTLRTLFAAAALVGAALIAAPAPQAHAAVFISVGIAPPAIPVYAQPLCPGDGYIWTPGYWAWGPEGYYWVDGAWILAPYQGALWTPGWWGFAGGAYVWYPGYWGRTVGYYGGVNYGYGYFGTGFYGGYWNGGHFFYNRAYGHFGGGFHGNFYERRVSGFDGRPGGASFNAHPPAQFANARGFSGVHGAVVEHGGGEFNHAGASQGFANRGNVNGGQGFNRGAQPGFNHQAPAYNNVGNHSFGQPQQNYGGNRGGANPSAAPHYNAPSGGGNRGGSAPAAHSAPAGGGSHGGGGESHNSGGGGGASHGGGGGHR
ncbi:MAG TPA: YXWGXW repeat-containing protein [Acidobacteriaceae bacterium]|jgi:hypothetical protein